MTKQHFTFKEVFNFGWTKTQQHWWFMLCSFVIYGIILSAVQKTEGFEILIGLLVALSLVSISLTIARNESFTFSSLFDKLRSPRLVIHFILLSAIYITAVVVFFIPFIASIFVIGNTLAGGAPFASIPGKLFGILFVSILLIIPSIFISVRFKFFPYVLIENEHLKFADVIKHTYKLTEGVFWKIFKFLIIIAIINTLGAISYVGLILTIPISIFAMAHFYRHLAGHVI